VSTNKLLEAVQAIDALLRNHTLEEPDILRSAAETMKDLVSSDEWLPPAMALPGPDFYRQYLLYGDPHDRFSLVSFVWGPGQETPVHDHTVWGVIGMLRGAETEQSYTMSEQGLEVSGPVRTLNPGDVAFVSPSIGDIHRVSNGTPEKVSISIHLYGGNIGRIQRHVYDAVTGQKKAFVSGYSNDMTPNLWAPTPAQN
jgi:predicted metal-dependent enzyme (double-stranded beta helix superfamily)